VPATPDRSSLDVVRGTRPHLVEESLMRQLRTHPIRTLAILLVTAFVLLMISGIPAIKNAKGWNVQDAIGYISWFGFLIAALLFVLGGAYTIVRAVRGRRLA
jgi:hypothetical protein